MSVLVFIDSAEGAIKRSSYEAITYAVEVSKLLHTDTIGVVIGTIEGDLGAETGKYGVKKVLHVTDARFAQASGTAYASIVAAAAEKEAANVIILSKSSLTDAMASRVAIKLKASAAANIIQLPEVSTGSFKVKQSIFTGKAFATIDLKAVNKVITIAKNAVQVKETGGNASVESFTPTVSAVDLKVKVNKVEKASGDILLTEADIVVSGGRGMKGPENWAVLEGFAKALGAATGCSKPVSDMGWRPHHEHVGQTGVKVSPNLYIALGISGAIQHLAGVNSSKVIVVINKDPEAPFFKAADYGIVGDIFDVVPKLTEAAKKL